MEEGSTLKTRLIPWTKAGAFYTATLGVPVLYYALLAFFNDTNPLVSVLSASLGTDLLLPSKSTTTNAQVSR